MTENLHARPSLPWEEFHAAERPEEFLSAPDLMLKGLHVKLLHFHHFCVELSSSLQEGETLKELFEIIDRESKAEFTFLLNCFYQTAKFHLEALFKSIILWKEHGHDDISGTTTLQEERIHNITNYIFSKISNQLLLGKKKKSLPCALGEKLSSVFLQEFLPHTEGTEGKNRAPKVASMKVKKGDHEVCSMRKEMLESYTQTIGLLSISSFPELMETYYQLMESNEGNVISLIHLTRALRNISIPLVKRDEVNRSKRLVNYFLSQIEKKPKPELIQSFIFTLGEILLPACELRYDTKPYHAEWREMVTECAYTLKKAAKKSKDPLTLTVLEIGTMCAGQKFLLGQQPIGVLDRLIKLLKVPDKRPVALDCIFFVITALFRNYDETDFDISTNLILEKIHLEVFHSMRKTNKECIPIMVELLFLICIFDMNFSFTNFVLPMAAPESTLELQIVGMEVFMAIADATHITFDKTFAFVKRKHDISKINYRYATHIASRLQEYGSVSVNLIESNLTSFQEALGSTLKQVDSLIGHFYRDTFKGGELSKGVEHALHLHVLRTSILCISRIPPSSSSFSTTELILFLTHKAFHADASVADESKKLLVALIRSRPCLRASIVEEIGRFILLIPHENYALIRVATSFLIEIISAWYDPLALNAREIDFEYIDGNVYQRNIFPAATLEAIALIQLCCPCVHVRNVTYNLLHEIKALHSVLPANFQEEGPRLISIISSHEKEIIQLCTSSRNGHYSSVEEVIVGCSEGEQEDWANCFGAVLSFLQQARATSLPICFSIACTRIEELTALHHTPKKEKARRTCLLRRELQPAVPLSTKATHDLILWRNIVLMCCSIIPEGGTNPFALEFGYEIEMNKDWFINTILPCFFHTNERIRHNTQLAFRHCAEDVTFSLPTMVSLYLHLEGQKRKDGMGEYVHLETRMLHTSLCEKYYASDSTQHPFEATILSQISETLEYLTQPGQEILYSLQQERFYFFKTLTALFSAMNKRNSVPTRKFAQNLETLLTFTMGFTGFGPLFWEQKDKQLKMKEAYLEKVKDKELASAEDAFTEDLQLVTLWANKALPGILSFGPFESSFYDAKGPLFEFTSEAFELGDDQDSLRVVLKNAIKSAPSASQIGMLRHCVDSSFHVEAKIADNYFLTISDTITSGGDISYPLLPVLCVAMFKMTDSCLRVRKSAASLVHWLSTRYFKTHLMVLYHHTSSHTPLHCLVQQRKVTTLFSELHEDVLIDCIFEIGKRLPQVNDAGQHRIACILIVFLARVDLEKPGQTTATQLIHLLIAFTFKLNEHRPDLVQQLWASLANSLSNVKNISDTFFALALDKQNESLTRHLQTLFLLIAVDEITREFLFEYMAKNIYSTTKRNFRSGKSASSSFAEEVPIAEGVAWNVHVLFQYQSFTPGLSKGEFSLTFVSELLLISKEAWTCHVPTYMAAAFLSMDQPTPFVYESCKNLLRNIIYCSVEDDLHPQSYYSNNYAKLSLIIENSGEQPLWNESDCSEATFKKTLDLCIALLLPKRNTIRIELSNEALQISSRINLVDHKICRALSMYRQLELTSFQANDIHELMGVLLLHIQSRESRNQVNTLMEIQYIFQYIIDISEPDHLISLPKVFWCGVALLRSDISQDYLGGVAILEKFIQRVDFYSPHVQEQLLSCFPYSWLPSFSGLGILLLKGFCSKYHESASRALMTRLIGPHSSDIVDTEPKRGKVVFIISMLPHLLTFLGGEHAEEIASQLAIACPPELGKIFTQYSVYRTSIEALRRFMLEVISKFTELYFPAHETFVFTLLIGMLEKGPKIHCKTILQIIEGLLQQVNFEQSILFGDGLAVFAPILNFLQGDLWPQSLAIINVILDKSPAASPVSIQQDQIPTIRLRLAECQKIYDHWNQLERGKAFVFSALAKVMEGSENHDPAQVFHHAASMKQLVEIHHDPNEDQSASMPNLEQGSSISKKKKRKTAKESGSASSSSTKEKEKKNRRKSRARKEDSKRAHGVARAHSSPRSDDGKNSSISPLIEATEHLGDVPTEAVDPCPSLGEPSKSVLIEATEDWDDTPVVPVRTSEIEVENKNESISEENEGENLSVEQERKELESGWQKIPVPSLPSAPSFLGRPAPLSPGAREKFNEEEKEEEMETEKDNKNNDE